MREAIAKAMNDALEFWDNHTTEKDAFGQTMKIFQHRLNEAGFVIVPKEPTEAMIEGLYAATGYCGDLTAHKVWRAMIEASQESE
jgi:hypothetical protein